MPHPRGSDLPVAAVSQQVAELEEEKGVGSSLWGSCPTSPKWASSVCVLVRGMWEGPPVTSSASLNRREVAQEG